MKPDIFAEWLRRQGYRVVRTPSSYWYEISFRVYQAFPFHWLIEPQEEELSGLLRSHRAIALRYSTPITASRGKLSYHVTYEGPSYDLPSLPRRARQNVRRGLHYATVEPIPISRLATEGWSLRLDSLGRQRRAKAENQAWWHRLCMSAEDLPGFEAWGALHDGQLVASFLSFACDDCYTLHYLQSATAHLEHRVNNALFYTVTREVLSRPGISKVFAGLQSLDAPPSVDEFKFRMTYASQPVRQRVVFHPRLAPFFGQPGHAVVKRLLRWFPDNPTLAKIEGMIRFYLEGQRPPSMQDCPERVAHQLRESLADA